MFGDWGGGGVLLKGEIIDQYSFHLVSHFEECRLGVNVNSKSIFWNFMDHFSS